MEIQSKMHTILLHGIIFENLATIDRANIVYKKEIAASTSNQQHVPRNVQQVRNLCFQAANSKRVSLEDVLCIQLLMILISFGR